jgi:hypothetical protein
MMTLPNRAVTQSQDDWLPSTRGPEANLDFTKIPSGAISAPLSAPVILKTSDLAKSLSFVSIQLFTGNVVPGNRLRIRISSLPNFGGGPPRNSKVALVLRPARWSKPSPNPLFRECCSWQVGRG